MKPGWVQRKGIEAAERVAAGLDRLRAGSRVTAWPWKTARNIAVVGTAADRDHVQLCLDAVGTHCPEASSSVIFEGKDLLSDGALLPLSHRFDLLILLHPYPYATAEAMGKFRQLRKLARGIRAGRRLLYFRNLELWDDRLHSRLLRRLLDVPRLAAARLATEGEAWIMDRCVTPALTAIKDKIIENPCRHEGRYRVFDYPRRVDFCPDCGMGIAGQPELQGARWIEATYGAAYAQEGRFLGHREWERHCAEFCERLRAMLAALGFDPDAPPSAAAPRRVLDAGCGFGRYVRLWMGHGWDYVGFDPSADNIRFAQADAAPRAGDGAGRPVFVCGGAECADVAERGPFDLITLCQVLEHVPDPGALLGQLRGLAAPEGRLYVEVPHAEKYTWHAARRGFANREHWWDFTPGMLAATVAAAGWRVLRWAEAPESDHYPVQAVLAEKT